MKPMHALFLILFIFASASASIAGERAALPDILAWPGKPLPRPPQRNMSTVAALPAHDDDCPVCGFAIAVPEPEKLMRGRNGADIPVPWEMDAAEQDSDMCPNPGAGKLAYQADLLVCPSCGLAARRNEFFTLANPDFRAWALEHLRPNIRAAQRQLLGRRGGELSDEECAAFFNRQEEIPDRLRTEHARSVYAALRAPPLVQAEMHWRAAWAARRALTLPPGDAALAPTARKTLEAVEKQVGKPGSVDERIQALVRLQGKNRSGKERLSGAERCVSLMLLAGLYDRRGDRDEADETLAWLRTLVSERYARAEQDPLWSATPSRVSKKEREKALEELRAALERETDSRVSLLSAEREYLRRAAALLKDALIAGELDGDPGRAVFFAYLVAEFQRRAGDLPLAAEWFKAVQGLTADGDPLRARAVRLLEAVGVQAGDRVNLLSGIGHDGEMFEKLRAIRDNPVKVDR